MGAFKVHQHVLFNNKKYIILEIRKGEKTNKPDYQAGILQTGLKSKPCTYRIKDGLYVRGDKLKKI